MEHPFVEYDALDKLTIEELYTKISELHRKMNMIRRLGNYSVINQMNMIIGMHNDILNKKLSKNLENANISDHVKIESRK